MVGFVEDWDQNATWNPNTPIAYTGVDQGLIDMPQQQTSAPAENAPAWNPNASQFDPTAFRESVQQNQDIMRPADNKPAEPDKSFWSQIGDSFSASMKKNGGEIFANVMAGSAQGVLAYLIQRRQERAARELEDQRNQNKVAETNASVARASAMPRLGSIVKPGVTGSQVPGSGGLIGATQQRRV